MNMKKKTNILIIPGNPSALYYYNKMKLDLETKLPPEFSIKVLGHIPVNENHTTLEKYTLDIIDYILSHTEQNTILIGHSIGGFFARELHKKYPEKFLKLIIIFPFFGAQNFLGSVLLKTTDFLHNKPLIRNKILKGLKKIENKCSALKNVTHNELSQGIKLGHLENKYFKGKLRLEEETESDKKTFFLYTKNDNWCTNKTLQKAMMTKMNISHIDSEHDFVLYDSEIETVNKLLVKILY